MIFIGIDNGTTGTISIIGDKGSVFHHSKMPVRVELTYTKEKKKISRIDVIALQAILKPYRSPCEALAILERPMVNPMRFKNSLTAIRALEATLIILERLSIPYRYIDSKEWQTALLPKGIGRDKNGVKTKDSSKELKRSACDIARRLFPSVKTKDADSLLIAEHARREKK
jgi:hypothetical protein